MMTSRSRLAQASKPNCRIQISNVKQPRARLSPATLSNGGVVTSGANESQSSPYDMSFTMSFTISGYLWLDTQQSTPNARKHTKRKSGNGNEPSRRAFTGHKSFLKFKIHTKCRRRPLLQIPFDDDKTNNNTIFRRRQKEKKKFKKINSKKDNDCSKACKQ
jgi:hypothetical protein